MKHPKRQKGFTLIELVVVAALIVIVTPVLYRLYHEGLRRGYTGLVAGQATIRDTRILFQYLERDLARARERLEYHESRRADRSTLILRTRGQASFEPAPGGDRVVVYHLDADQQVVREEYPAPAASARVEKAPPDRTGLLGEVTFLEFQCGPAGSAPAWIKVVVTRSPALARPETLTRVLALGSGR